jgi:hypothetical protein
VIQRVGDLLQDTLGVVQNIVIPEAKHTITRLSQKLSPPLIRLNLVGMMSAIKLNDQQWAVAGEI